jgi:hypothetical protein
MNILINWIRAIFAENALGMFIYIDSIAFKKSHRNLQIMAGLCMAAALLSRVAHPPMRNLNFCDDASIAALAITATVSWIAFVSRYARVSYVSNILFLSQIPFWVLFCKVSRQSFSFEFFDTDIIGIGIGLVLFFYAPYVTYLRFLRDSN